MKALILLLLGACQALQPGLEYQYHYSGRVATGIPDLQRQFAAAGIQADVTVQMFADHATVIQFSNIEVGELNKVLDCDLRAPVPIEYHPLQEQAALLEKPFRIAVKESGVPDHMDAPEEPVWVSNIRKSVANIFRIPMLWQPEAYASKLNFGAREDSLAGFCQNWYSSLKLPVHIADEVNIQREQSMEEDVQRDSQAGGYTKGKSKTSKTSKTSSKTSKTSKTGKTSPGRLDSNIPTIEDTLFTVSRTTDFDMCEGMVSLEIHGPKDTQDIIQRSSVGTYLVRGVTHKRIEQVIVEGSITVLTNKERNEHLDTFTNQTLELKAVRELKDPLEVDYESHPHYSWHYDIERPQADGQFIPLEQAITGKPVTAQMANNIVEYIKKTITEIQTKVYSESVKPENLAYQIGRLVEAMANLDRAHIEILFTVASPTPFQKAILTQLLINAGTEPAVTYALELASTDVQFRDDFYDVLPKVIRSPAAIPKIMAFLMDKDADMSHFFGLMNFATLANEGCLNPKRKHFYYDFSCGPHSVCQPEVIVETFIPYLQQGLHDEDVWKRLLYVQALSNLGTPQTIDILKPIMIGTTETDVFLRTNAIWSLSAFNQHKASLSQVYEILMPIIDNPGEQFEIRSIAFLTLVTWGPGNAWWQQVAYNTWHDPSPQYANFVSTTISSVANSDSKLSDVAKRVEHLCKPATMSVLHASNAFLHEYLFSDAHGIKLNFAWFAGVHGVLPEEVFIRLQEELFYGYVGVLKVDMQQRGVDRMWKIVQQYISTKPKKTAASTQEIVTEMWEELKEKIGIAPSTSEPDIKLWFKMDRVIHKIAHLVDQEDQMSIPQNIVHLEKYLNSPVFSRYLSSFVALPTDLGIPFSATYMVESAYSIKMQAPPEYDFVKPKFKANVNFLFELGEQAFVEVRAYLPWSQHPGISSGIYRSGNLVLPLNVHASLDLSTQEVQLSAEMTTDTKLQVFHIEMVPYTVLENNYPNEVLIIPNEYKPIMDRDTPIFTNKRQAFPRDVGLFFEVSTEGDMRFPPSLHQILTMCQGTYYSYVMWEQTVVFDPAASTTKTVTLTFNYVSSGASADIEEQTDYEGQFTQSRGRGSDYEFGGQFHQSTDFQDITEVDSFQTQSQTRERIMKLQQQLIVSGGLVRTLSVFIELQGTPTRNYEASLTWAVSSSPSGRSFKVQVTLLKHPAAGALESAHTTCLNILIAKPKFEPFLTVDELLATNFHTTLRAELFDGETCEEAPIFTVEGSFDVSENKKNLVKGSIEDGCDYNTYAPAIDVITTAVYDRAHFVSTWTMDVPDTMKNISYLVVDTVRGLLPGRIDTDYTTIYYDNKIDVDATKCPCSGLWTIRVEKPSAVSVVKDFDFPEWTEVFFTPAPLVTTLMYDEVVGRTPVACTVDETYVRTFDGKVFDYEPGECWNAMTFDMSNSQVGAMLVRYTGQWEVRIIWNEAGLVFDLSPTNFLVNGEPAKGSDDRYTVIHNNDSHIIMFTSGTRVKVSNKVELLMALNHRGYTAGICGNYDGEPSNDMVGPQGCTYTDSELFALSWASPGEGCSSFSFNSKKRRVERYQEDCHHFSYETTGTYHDQDAYECTDWVYNERVEGVYHCKALSPTPVCKPHCVGTFPISESVEYECRYSGHKEQAQSQQQHQQQAQGTSWDECFPRSYVHTYPASCVPQ